MIGSSMIQIRSCKSKQDLKEFIRLPWEFYKNDQYWCPPFISECKKMFSEKHPFHEYGKMELFLAEREGKTVGRIAAILNKLHLEQHGDNAGFFGFFEAINDQNVANALLNAAKTWLKEQGLTKMIGPASPSSNYDYGCQFTGFEYDQVLLSTHNASYYLNLFENYGLQKSIDLFAYKISRDSLLKSPLLQRLSKIEKRTSSIRIREMNKRKTSEEITLLMQIFNLCWKGNHGFVPITKLETKFLYTSLRLLIDKSFVLFAEINQQVVGGAIFILDYNQLFKKMNGKISLWNLFKIFSQKKKITWLRGFILGVLPEYRNHLVFPLLFGEAIKRGLSTPTIQYLEGSYILETNLLMRSPLEMIGGEIYKKYRVFETVIN